MKICVFSTHQFEEKHLRQANSGRHDLQRLYPGITTKEIYRRAFSMLRKASAHLAAEYKLKKAFQELGPSGYPFEKYIGEILNHKGYKVQVGKMAREPVFTLNTEISGKLNYAKSTWKRNLKKSCGWSKPLHL